MARKNNKPGKDKKNEPRGRTYRDALQVWDFVGHAARKQWDAAGFQFVPPNAPSCPRDPRHTVAGPRCIEGVPMIKCVECRTLYTISLVPAKKTISATEKVLASVQTIE